MYFRSIVVFGLAMVCVACSQKHDEAVAPAVSSTAPAVPPAPPVLAASASSPSGLTYLYDLMQHPDFASAFVALSGADLLPPWTTQGGTSTPAQQLDIGGHTKLLAAACKPHDCPAERILVLYDENTHAMSGVFARRKANASNDADTNDPANDELIWLGAPDDATKKLLQRKLYKPE